MADPSEPLVQTCPSCAALIDVSEEAPFSLMHCPTCGAGMRVRKTFDHFELQEELGSGGMGTVYRALDRNLNRIVALKLLRQEYSRDPDFVRKFQAEAAITASINHPNVVRVYSTGTDHDLLYLAMELVDKGSLDDLMTLQGRVAEAQVLTVGIQIARGLQAAFQRGLIHRDIKPGNILFSDAHTAKIVDFGLAVFMDQAIDEGAEIWGTPYYVAPEKLDAQPEDLRSDIYSLGASLFHAVAGRPPFEAETASMVALKHLKSQSVSLQAFAPDVASATAYVINKCLQKDPTDRYQNYEELIEHLEYAHTERLKTAARRPQRGGMVIEAERSQRAMGWITGAMIALVVIIGVGAFLMRNRNAPRAENPAVEATRKAAAAVDPRYEEARQKILTASPPEAIEAISALEKQPNVPQPLRNWITVHAGMAHLLASQEKESRTVFADLEARGPYSTDPSEQKLAKFFVELGRTLSRGSSISASVAKDYDKSTYEALALFLFALKSWELQKFDEAGPLFRQFQSSPLRKKDPSDSGPASPYAWVGEYKDLSSRYIADFAEYRGVVEILNDTSTLEAQKKALEEARGLRSRLQQPGSLPKALDKRIADLEREIAVQQDAEAKITAEQDAADTRVFTEAKPKAAALSGQYRFNEARAALVNIQLTGEKGRREQEALAKKMEWLAKFKSLLVKDLNAAGFPHAISKRNGAVVAGGIGRATEQQIETRTPYGVVPVPWPEVAQESVIAMAQSFMRPGMPNDLLGDRKWLLGVFSFYARKQREGRSLVAEAAQSRKEYSDALPLFLEFAEAQ